MADKNTVMDLLTDEIKDLYSAEKQLTKAIPALDENPTDRPFLGCFLNRLNSDEFDVGHGYPLGLE